VTPKGGHAKPAHMRAAEEQRVEASSRYTPPVPQYKKQSSPWVAWMMFALMGLGALVILLYYLGAVPGGRSNWYLGVGLVSLLAGLYTATKYH